MAASALTVQTIVPAGLQAAMTAANADGNYFQNDGRVFLAVKNESASGVNVTIASHVKCNQGSTHNLVVTVASGKTGFIGPFSRRFHDDDGRVQVTYSAVESVTVGAFRLP